MRHRQRSSYFVTGTDTGVGKTVVAAGLARVLVERGERVGVLKPAETGWTDDADGWPADGALLAAAARVDEPVPAVVPYIYREPLAPLVSARREERPIDPGVIRAAYDDLAARYDRVLVEGAGGLSVPLTDDLDMAGLANLLELPVLVVARPSLGTLNHTFLTVHYARSRGLQIAGIVISGYDANTTDVAERTNPDMMEEMCGVPILARIARRDAIRSAEDAAEAVLASGLADALEATDD